MQGDLISRSALIHYLDNQIVECNDFEERSTLRSIVSVVEEQPTAYDVEKVVADVKEENNQFIKDTFLRIENMVSEIARKNYIAIRIRKHIGTIEKIVCNGGKE